MSDNLEYFDLNAMLSLRDENGKIDFSKDKEAARKYFLQHVNQNTVFFHTLEEKLNYLFKEGYYKKSIFDLYSFKFTKNLYKKAYDKKFRFESFMGAYKFYTSYAMRTTDGTRYLERFEDRVVAVALTLAKGDEALAIKIVDEIISGRYQPATPTFLNAAKVKGGEQVSCFLVRVEDNMESISRVITSALQLSKRGGGVGILLSNVREEGAPIKGMEGMSSGIVPIMKILEDSFSYANQLGARQGAGVVYLNAHHPDILKFLDTKRENADEKIRIKTLSLGVVIPDITMQLAAKNENMYLFSPYDVEREYGKAFADISVTEKYYEMVENKNIRKKKISARELLQTIAEIQFESGYPYILFEDNVNRQNTGGGRVNMSNLCIEIVQENEASLFNEDGSYEYVGKDISCNLGSQNIAKMMEHNNFEESIEIQIRSLTNVAKDSNINSVPSIQRGNQETLAIGLGAMNLHGYLGKERIFYGSEECLDFVSTYFATVRYYALLASNKMAIENGKPYVGFENSKYASGIFFDKYTSISWEPKTEKVKKLFAKIKVPTINDWTALKESIMAHGIANKYLMAIAPTGSISYVNNSSSSIHPITNRIETRKEGKIGRVRYAAPYLNNDNEIYFEDAYEIGPEKLIDVYAAATEHIDQSISATLFFKATATTRDVNKAQLYAFKKGMKSLYYIRIRQDAVKGTEIQECASCTI